MKLRQLALALALLLALCSSCAMAKPAESWPVGVPCPEPEAGEPGAFVSFYTVAETSDSGFPTQWQQSFRFDGLASSEYDLFAAPARFEGDKSLWMTYNRDGDFDNCVLGRSITVQEEWDYFHRVLFSAEYEAAPDGTACFGTPEFILRQGTACAQSTSRNPPGGKGYIDDELCRYRVSSDGSVLRIDADGSIFRIVTPLEAETVARLYLLYETYFRSCAVLSPCGYDLNELGQDIVLLVRRGEEELSIPREKWEDFLALVSVEEDKELSAGPPCYAVVNELFLREDYPAPQVLRFRFVRKDDDPDAAPFRWFSLREDGRLILESPQGAGMTYPIQVRWTVSSAVRYVSRAVFDKDAILQLIFP